MLRSTAPTSASDANAAGTAASVWRLICGSATADPFQPQIQRGAVNMAVDQALLESVQRGGPPALRFYRWQPACLSLGRNQPARVDRARLARDGIDLVRRPTGGLAVLHDHELTYCVVLPVGLLGSPRETYEAINRGLLAGLVSLGLGAAGVAALDSSPQVFRKAGSCFAASAPGEVLALGRKLIGSAQRYERRSILQHGSILVDDDQQRAARLLGRTDAPPPESTSLREVLGYVPPWAELTASFANGLSLHLGIPLAPAGLTEIERQRVLELTARFASEEWTSRI
jgi:lipoyl(octanoyl) transferase